MPRQRVVLGLSGGVDSAVAAELLKRDGLDVYGLYLDIGLADAAKDAVSVAHKLDIPLVIRDIHAELEENVCTPFVAAYLRGETPNPCIICNPAVKFRALCAYADELGAKYIATGHYARVKNGVLFKGMPSNDQSYMLCRLTRQQLSRLILPLGAYEKSRIRALAAEMNLHVASKPDSMEICFIPDGDYASFIESRGDAPPRGSFIDEAGNILGTHMGIHRYTLGQRRGLKIALGRRMFVSELRPDTNEIVLSEGDGLYVSEISAADINWQRLPPDSPFRATVKVRHSKAEAGATVTHSDNALHIEFDEPVRAPTAGQSAVLYDGDAVIAGATISVRHKKAEKK